MNDLQKAQWQAMVNRGDELVVAVNRDLELLYEFAHYVANDWIEASFDKVLAQRGDFIKRARQVIEQTHCD